MKAMILAAGKGTRLRPLTNTTPKALIELNGMPLLEILIRKMIQSGIREICINTYYLAQQIHDFIEKHQSFGIDIQFSDENDLLDTGGGIKHAAPLLQGKEDILIHNVDILSNLDFQKMLQHHQQKKNMVTLAVSDRKGSRYFLFDEKEHLCGWTNKQSGEIKEARKVKNYHHRAFSGIQIISPLLLDYFPSERIFSLVDFYLDVCRKEVIEAFPHDAEHWYDVGKIEDIEYISEQLKHYP
jgi:MurNAc alpha-1-phosphate uridylyltransferase